MSEREVVAGSMFAAEWVDHLTPEDRDWTLLETMAKELLGIEGAVEVRAYDRSIVSAWVEHDRETDRYVSRLTVHDRDRLPIEAEQAMLAHETLQADVFAQQVRFRFRAIEASPKKRYTQPFKDALREIAESRIVLNDPKHHQPLAQGALTYGIMTYLKHLREFGAPGELTELGRVMAQGYSVEKQIETEGDKNHDGTTE